MNEIRFAHDLEIEEQKKIWKLCFGDADNYIDLFYAHRYNKDETVLLLSEEKIAARLTMLPAKILTPQKRSFEAAILYAIATHPDYRNRRFASQIIDFAEKQLALRNKAFSLLVPATVQLFDFYRKLGYEAVFYIRELTLNNKQISNLSAEFPTRSLVLPATAERYNSIRNSQLKGRLFIAYTNADISYQKKLSQESGADIFTLEAKEFAGCMAIERISSDKIFIKELLVPDQYISGAIKQIAGIMPAKEYLLRTPVFLGETLGGIKRPFAVYKKLLDVGIDITPADNSYLGLAFD